MTVQELGEAVLEEIAEWNHWKCGSCYLCIGTECIADHPPPEYCESAIHKYLWHKHEQKKP